MLDEKGIFCKSDLIDLQEIWQISLLGIGSNKSELWSDEREQEKNQNVDSNAQRGSK